MVCGCSQRDDKVFEYLFVGLVIFGFIVMFAGWGMVGAGILVGLAFLLTFAIVTFQNLEEVDCILTHCKGEDALREAMKTAKESRNDSFFSWIIGGVFFLFGLIIHSLAVISLVGIGNLANFIVMVMAHSKYKEVRKLLILRQLQKDGKAVIVDI